MLVTDAMLQLSLVTGVPGDAIVAEHEPAFTFVFTVAGHVIVGLILSTLVTLKEQLATLPAASVAIIVMVTVPVPDTEVPAAGDCTSVIAAAALQLSDFVTAVV